MAIFKAPKKKGPRCKSENVIDHLEDNNVIYVFSAVHVTSH